MRGGVSVMRFLIRTSRRRATDRYECDRYSLLRSRNEGRILITGSIAGFMPGSYQAVYNGTKAFLDSFSYALREELKDTDVTVTCLMPGATETEFFRRADMLDTKVGTASPAKVAKDGFKAMMAGEGGVV